MDLIGGPDRAATTSPPSQRIRARLSAVIPAKDEARNIGWVLRRLPDSVDEVILVDGSSTDGTVDIARMIRPDIVVVPERERGKGSALRAGVEAATGDYVVMLDADGSMDPQDIDRFVEALDAGYDLVKGSRFMPDGGTADMTPLRDIGNKGLLFVSNLLFQRQHTDLCYGFAAFRRGAFQELELTAQGFEIEAQLFLRATRRGLRVTEIPSFEAPRRYGNSNLNTFRDGWRVLRTILWERVRISRGAIALEPATMQLQSPGFLSAILAAEPTFAGAPPSAEVDATVSNATSDPLDQSVPAPGQRPGITVPADPRDDRTGDPAERDDRFGTRRAALGRMPLGHNVPD
jgi:Glycosyl transferase family 2